RSPPGLERSPTPAIRWRYFRGISFNARLGRLDGGGGSRRPRKTRRMAVGSAAPPGSPFERTGSPAPSHLSARLAFGSWPAGHSVHALHHAAHGPVAAGPMHSPAHVSQHDAGDGLLLVVQRGVERLEGFRERLHALGTLGHTLADAVEPVGER